MLSPARLACVARTAATIRARIPPPQPLWSSALLLGRPTANSYPRQRLISHTLRNSRSISSTHGLRPKQCTREAESKNTASKPSRSARRRRDKNSSEAAEAALIFLAVFQGVSIIILSLCGLHHLCEHGLCPTGKEPQTASDAHDARRAAERELARTVTIWRELKAARQTGDAAELRAAVFAAAARHWRDSWCADADWTRVEVVDLGPLEAPSLVRSVGQWLSLTGGLDLARETRVFVYRTTDGSDAVVRVVVAVNAEQLSDDKGFMAMLAAKLGTVATEAVAQERARAEWLEGLKKSFFGRSEYLRQHAKSKPAEVVFLLREEQKKSDMSRILGGEQATRESPSNLPPLHSPKKRLPILY